MSITGALQTLFFVVFLGGYAILAIVLFWGALGEQSTEVYRTWANRRQRRAMNATEGSEQVLREKRHVGGRKDEDVSFGMPSGFLPATRSRVTR